MQNSCDLPEGFHGELAYHEVGNVLPPKQAKTILGPDPSRSTKRLHTTVARHALNETTNTISVDLTPAIADMLICKVCESGSSTHHAEMDGSPPGH